MTARLAENLLARHPLQRWSSPSRDASAGLHILGLASFAYSFSYLVRHPNPINDSYGWHLQYLTILGLALSALTFALGLLADLTLSRRLFKWKNYLSVASAPMECLITLLYWGLRAIDPTLVQSPHLPALPLETDISFHFIPAFALISDLLFFSPPYTIAFLPALGLSLAIACSYWLWIEQCYRYNNFYPYPLFAMLSTTQRAVLFGASAMLMTLATVALIWLYGMVNGKRVDGRFTEGNLRRVRSGDVKGLREAGRSVGREWSEEEQKKGR